MITVAAPDACCALTDAARAELLSRGYLEVRSNRTGQPLRVGRAWLDEQCADPPGHDVLRAAAQIACPMLVVHGTRDPTVPPAAAPAIARVAPRAKLLLIDGADHVMNTPNPCAADAHMSSQLRSLLDECLAFLAALATPDP